MPAGPEDPALSRSAPLLSSGAKTPLTKDQRIRRFGVSCVDGLEWRAGWEPGGEYTKQLVIKNVSTKAMKISYKLPDSKYFSMAFPEPIQLTPGLSKSLQVIFRPVLLEAYDDFVTFFTEKGSFVVPIRAAIPCIHSKVPEQVDFGFCPVQESGVKTFTISNDGEAPVSFSWSCEPPFTVSPTSGSMAPGTSATMTARFTPTDACVYVARAICNVPEHTMHTVKIGGIGKYPFLSASCERLDFGQVLSGTNVAKQFKLVNRSLVYARFSISRRDSDVGAVFAFSPTSGIVPPDGEQNVTIHFNPQVTGTYTNDHYIIKTPGGNGIPLECVGEAVGPQIELSKSLVNFGDVPIELPRRSVHRTFEVINHSDLPTWYQLYDCEPNGVFRVQGVSGMLPPRVAVHV